MARKPRIEYAGAVYHVMSRGNRQSDIYLDDQDRTVFLDTLSEACDRQGWLIHAYVLMDNHYHLLLETPESNLVVGMKWLQGTYTQRFNSRHKEWGHLFQGRYKALVVQPDGGCYFSTVATYIHLNPVRAKMMDFKCEDLSAYAWSSYPLYYDPDKRPSWLVVDRVLGNHQWRDDASGLNNYRRYIKKRTLEVYGADDPFSADAEWKSIRRGWCMGDQAFREEMEGLVEKRISGYDRRSYLGEEVKKHDEAEAERLFQFGLDALGLKEADLLLLKKSDVRKRVIAWGIRTHTSVRNDWICERLVMGRASNLARHVRGVAESTDADIVKLAEMIKKAF